MPMEAEFDFIGERYKLVAYVNGNHQKLIFREVDPETGSVLFEDSLNCIHTAIMDIPAESFEETVSDPDFEKNVIKIRSSEGLHEISLSPQDRFIAMKSWVAGIAEAGIAAIKLQTDIEHAASFQFPISSFLMRCIMRVNKEYILEFLDYIERECRYTDPEGNNKLHKPCITSNVDMCLKIMFKVIYKDYRPFRRWLDKNPVIEEIIRRILELSPDIKIFTESPERLIILSYPDAANLEGFEKLINSRNSDIKVFIAQNPEATRFPNFVRLFTDKNEDVLMALARNPKAPEFPEYRLIINSDSFRIRYHAARNPGAVNHPDYIRLFDDPDIRVRRAVYSNPNARRFPQYKDLLPAPTLGELYSLLTQPEALKYSEFKKILEEKNDITALIKIAGNQEAPKLKEFGYLIKHGSANVRSAAASNPNGPLHPDFTELLRDPDPYIAECAEETLAKFRSAAKNI